MVVTESKLDFRSGSYAQLLVKEKKRKRKKKERKKRNTQLPSITR